MTLYQSHRSQNVSAFIAWFALFAASFALGFVLLVGPTHKVVPVEPEAQPAVPAPVEPAPEPEPEADPPVIVPTAPEAMVDIEVADFTPHPPRIMYD